jgi:hypothetical protein
MADIFAGITEEELIMASEGITRNTKGISYASDL